MAIALAVAALSWGAAVGPAAPAADADAMYRQLQEIQHARPPEGIPYDGRHAWYDAQMDKASRLAEEFVQDFPDDPRRQEVLAQVATVSRLFTGPDAGEAKAAWLQHQVELRRELLADSNLPEKLVGTVYIAELRPFLDAGEGRKIGPEDDVTAQRLLAAFARRAPDSGSRVYAESRYLDSLQERDPAAAETYARKLAGDPNEGVAKTGRQKVAALELRKAPISIRRTAFDGREVDFTKLRGKVVLIDFWATWCVPCMQQMPEIKRVYAKYHDQGLEVIGITDDIPPHDPDHPRGVEKTPAMLKAFLEKEGMPWPQIWDMESTQKRRGPKELLVMFGVSELPTTLLLDKDGRIAFTDNHGEKLEQNVKALLTR